MSKPEVGIQELALENVMGDRFGRYSKYIIQERALPDLRDGLKPVQRRILYAMYKDGNMHNKGFRKAAKTVGNVIGNYHPHGDSSVYEAMVRLSQDWKMREPLVEMHGNNGSMDGDPAAAMRYTEARLSMISEELLRDIQLETVPFILNFDDTEYEPTVLPARFPNLIVNGATGISAGYATDIPPHNLGEVLDATIHLVKHPQARLETLMSYVKGPDFPTGAIVQGEKGLKQAYKTGRGRIIIRSKTDIVTLRGGREMIVVEEIPYEVNKNTLVRKIDSIRIQKEIEGIAEVRDESDRQGLRIAIELRTDANAEGILNYLLKNTDLQVSYNFNMIAIDDYKPRQVGLHDILTSYLKHKREVIIKRTTHLLQKAKDREHIVQGLILAVSILDEVIQTIRESNNKSHAKVNLINEYGFTEKQAEAIVTLQLYRLTNTDIVELESESEELNKNIAKYQTIINEDDALNQVVIEELLEMKKKYATPRQTVIESEIEEIKIEKEVLVPEEDVIVTVTKEGYLKRTSLRSFGSSTLEDLGIREGDDILFAKKMSTLDQLIIFTNKGNFINRYVHELSDIRWKDLGQHLSQDIRFLENEKIQSVFAFTELPTDDHFVFITKDGRIKQTVISDFEAKRSHLTQSYQAIKLQGEQDELINVIEARHDTDYDVFLVTKAGFGLRYPLSEVSIYGPNAAGVISINLKEKDEVVGGAIFDPEQGDTEALFVTQRGSLKKMLLNDFDKITRARRGLSILRPLKAKPHEIALFIPLNSDDQIIEIQTNTQEVVDVQPNDYLPTDRTNNGSFILEEETDGRPVLYNRKLSNILQEINE